jgi:uncharacterized protein DUF5683
MYRPIDNMKQIILPVFVLVCLFLEFDCTAQRILTDSVSIKNASPALKAAEDSIRKTHSPRKAAIRSAILPGWGQIYNKKYWKLPIVYGGLGAVGAVFVYNLKNYRDTRFAYQAKYKAALPPNQGRDSTDYWNIKPELLILSLESLRFYRNEFRRDIDYSVLFFLIIWGLNVIDATVDAHLKGFDVSPDLGLKIKPGHSSMANTNGISFVLNIK